jgi:DNA-binding response OmpR family regulator
VVEDDPLFARTIRRLCASRYDVVLAGSFREAVPLLGDGDGDGGTFDAYVLDLHLGDGHAKDLLDLMDDAQRRRVVIVTGGAFSDLDRHFLRTVLNPPLTKPFPRERLHEALFAILRNGAPTGPRSAPP